MCVCVCACVYVFGWVLVGWVVVCCYRVVMKTFNPCVCVCLLVPLRDILIILYITVARVVPLNFLMRKNKAKEKARASMHRCRNYFDLDACPRHACRNLLCIQTPSGFRCLAVTAFCLACSRSQRLCAEDEMHCRRGFACCLSIIPLIVASC